MYEPQRAGTLRGAVAILGLTVSAMMPASPVQAVTVTWTGGSTVGPWWDYGDNWSSGAQPAPGDSVNLTQAGATDQTVSYFNTAYQGPYDELYSLTIDGTGSGTMTLSHTHYNHPLQARYEYIGYSGYGAITQSNGTNAVTYNLILGYEVGSRGAYELSGTGVLSADYEYIGNYGTGIFTQTGGSNTVTYHLYLGSAPGAVGRYTLSGGTLDVGGDIIGPGAGILTIDGGTLTVGGGIGVSEFIIGEAIGSSGTYELSGTGALSADYEYIGQNGTGVFIQNGGTHTVTGSLTIGNAGVASGRYELSGTGVLSANEEYLGAGGTSVFIQTGGSHTVTNNLNFGGDSGNTSTYTLSGGTLNVGGDIVDTTGGTSTLNIDGGTLTVGGGIDVDMLVLGSAAGATGSHALSGTGAITAGTEVIGGDGTGVFTQTGGAHTVTTDLQLGAGSGATGTYTLSGGTLNVGGDIVDGAGTGTLNIDGGTLIVSGSIGVDFLSIGKNGFHSMGAGQTLTAMSSITNAGYFNVGPGATVSANGTGLVNEGWLTVEGELSGDGALVNYGQMSGTGVVGGSGGLTNYGSLAPGDGLVLDSSGANTNYGNLDVAGYGRFVLGSGNLDNSGSLRLNGGLVIGAGTLTNGYGGTISGSGTVSSTFVNSGGVLVVENGTTNITQGFDNGGIVQLAGYTANLTGGAINNTGTIEGYGHVGNDVANTGTVEAIGGTLTLSGAVSNGAGGLMTAGAGAKLVMAGGMAANAGIINLNGGTFDNNNQPLTSTGQISGHGILRTGGLTNQGSATFTGGNTTVNGDVTNAPGAMIEVAHDAAVFTGDVVNNGTFKTTNTTVTFAGTYTENGLYYSDPSNNYFTDLTVGATGYLQGGVGDNWYVSGDFVNNSQQNTLWDTSQASLFLNGTGTQTLSLAGVDLGADPAGYIDNFAWGEFSLGSGVTLNVLDSDSDGDAALYAGLVSLEQGADLATLYIDYILSDYNIYYDPALAGNAYLEGNTFALNGGGFLKPAAVPVPPALWLLGSGVMGLLGVARRRRRDSA